MGPIRKALKELALAVLGAKGTVTIQHLLARLPPPFSEDAELMGDLLGELVAAGQIRLEVGEISGGTQIMVSPVKGD